MAALLQCYHPATGGLNGLVLIDQPKQNRFLDGTLALDRIYKYLYIRVVQTKALFWVGSSLDDIRRFSQDARRLAGHQLRLVQQGLEPADSKPMPSVGAGAYELRIHVQQQYRIFYIARLPEGIFVLHAFQKRTRKTLHADMELARARLRHLLSARRRTRSERED